MRVLGNIELAHIVRLLGWIEFSWKVPEGCEADVKLLA